MYSSRLWKLHSAGGLDAGDEDGVGAGQLPDHLLELRAAGQLVDVLDGGELGGQGAVQRIAASALLAKGTEAVGDAPGFQAFVSQALLDVFEVAIAQRAQEPTHGNAGGVGALGDAVGGLEGQLLRIGQQVACDAFAGGRKVGEGAFEGLEEEWLGHTGWPAMLSSCH